MAAAMTHRHRMLARHLVQVLDRKRALVLHLGVVEEEALDPEARGRGLGLGAQLLHDAGDGDELDLVRIADDDLVEQDRAGRVVVRVDKPGTTVMPLAS